MSSACLYEKHKTEAIIESLEDGVVLSRLGGNPSPTSMRLRRSSWTSSPPTPWAARSTNLSSNSPHYSPGGRDALRGKIAACRPRRAAHRGAASL